MSQHITAIYENGVLRPLAPLDLQDRQIVSLAIDSASAADENGAQEQSTLFDVFDEVGLVGCVMAAPPDLSTNAKYLHGFGHSGN